MEILLVNGFTDSNSPTQIIFDELIQMRHRISSLNLAEEGFDNFMSGTERDSYHDDHTLVTLSQRKSSELVKATNGLILCYPLKNDIFPPMVKSWFERVFIPGVSFTFTESGKVKGALKNLRFINFLILAEPNTRTKKWSDPNRSLLRAIRMNAGLRCKTFLSIGENIGDLGIAAQKNLNKIRQISS